MCLFLFFYTYIYIYIYICFTLLVIYILASNIYLNANMTISNTINCSFTIYMLKFKLSHVFVAFIIYLCYCIWILLLNKLIYAWNHIFENYFVSNLYSILTRQPSKSYFLIAIFFTFIHFKNIFFIYTKNLRYINFYTCII